MILPSRTVGAADVADHYDDLDWAYRAVWGEHVHHGLWRNGRESVEQAVQGLIDLVADRAAVRVGSNVCDVGCGYGATARYLQRTRGASVTGITLSARQHAVGAQGEPVEGVELRLGDWMKNGFAAASFDAVIAIESTEHMVDKTRCFAEMYRVLRPGGRIAISAWLAAESPRAWEVRHLLEPICAEGRLPGLGSASDYRSWLTTSGFHPCHEEELTREVKRTWSLCIRRSLASMVRDARFRRYLFGPAHFARNREFLRTMLRIRLAYETGAMRYGVFAALKGGAG